MAKPSKRLLMSQTLKFFSPVPSLQLVKLLWPPLPLLLRQRQTRLSVCMNGCAEKGKLLFVWNKLVEMIVLFIALCSLASLHWVLQNKSCSAISKNCFCTVAKLGLTLIYSARPP